MPEAEKPLVDIIMGSDSDLETMQHCSVFLTMLGIRHRIGVISAHRTPDWLSEYVKAAEAAGIKIIIAGAGGSAALPGDIACRTPLMVIGVPIENEKLRGLDALLSMQQLPTGVALAVMPIGIPGAKNAAYLAAKALGISDPAMLEAVRSKQQEMPDDVRAMNAKLQPTGLAVHIPLTWLDTEEKS